MVAPAWSLAMIGDGTRSVAGRRLGSIGLKVSFGQHVETSDDFVSSSVAERVDDLHEAFRGSRRRRDLHGDRRFQQQSAPPPDRLVPRASPRNGAWAATSARLNLLHGTEFMPDLDGFAPFVEDDAAVKPWDFDRDLVSLIQQPGFDCVRALVIGQFQRASGMTRPLLERIVTAKPELSDVPVVANVDFGHTTPIITFPIGGTVLVVADRESPGLTIIDH